MPLEDLLGSGDAGGDAEARPFLVWGARPCDMKGVELVDRVFTDRLEDPAYARRRSGMAFAGFVCASRGPSCFCHLLGVDRTSAEGMDIMLVEEGDGLLVIALTDAGERMVKAGGDLLEDAGDAGRAGMDAVLEKARREDRESAGRAWGGRTLEHVTRGLEGRWKSGLWSRIADTCLACGVCSFVCPLCWCFDVRDLDGDMVRCLEGGKPQPVEDREPAGGNVRIRCWDSCQLGHYGRMAGGGDPYADAGARVRHRIFHKLSYIPREYGLPGCTGCGRCVQACPSGLDVREILSALAAEEENP
jgi:ferredoxin